MPHVARVDAEEKPWGTGGILRIEQFLHRKHACGSLYGYRSSVGYAKYESINECRYEDPDILALCNVAY